MYLKNKLSIVVYFTISFIFIGTMNAFSGAWLKPKKEAFLKVGFTGIVYSSVFDMDGEIKDIAPISHYHLQLYGIYGLSEHLNAIIDAPLFISNKQDADPDFNISEDRENAGMGDIKIGLSYGIYKGEKFVVSASYIQSLATGINDDPFLLNTGYADYGQQLFAEIGYGSNSGRFFSEARLGFGNHNDGFSDDFLADIKAGYKLNKILWILASFGGLQPFENGDKEKALNPYGLYSNNAGYLYFGSEIIVQLNSFISVSASAYGALKGQNVQAAPSFNAGILFSLKKKNHEAKPAN